MSETEYETIGVFDLTLTGRIKAGHTITLRVFVIASTQEAALNFACSFMVKLFPSVQAKGIKASWAIEELLIDKKLRAQVD